MKNPDNYYFLFNEKNKGKTESCCCALIKGNIYNFSLKGVTDNLW